jgi:hypothetical protein
MYFKRQVGMKKKSQKEKKNVNFYFLRIFNNVSNNGIKKLFNS